MRTIKPCPVADCNLQCVRGGTMCGKHRSRLRTHGTTDAIRSSGRPPVPAIDRFLAKVTFGDHTFQGTRCLIWTGARSESGYGRFTAEIHGRRNMVAMAHRWIYERWVGAIPDGMEVDHLCHDPAVCTLGDECPHRRCMNSTHLTVVAPGANGLRSSNVVKTHCKHGHAFTPENTYLQPATGSRSCRTCRKEQRPVASEVQPIPKQVQFPVMVRGKVASRRTVKARTRKIVAARDGDWCLLCGLPPAGLHLHRVRYGSEGGVYEPSNCVQLCQGDHALVHSNKRLWQPLLLAFLADASVDNLAPLQTLRLVEAP